jgi:hypothetical protein
VRSHQFNARLAPSRRQPPGHSHQRVNFFLRDFRNVLPDIASVGISLERFLSYMKTDQKERGKSLNLASLP